MMPGASFRQSTLGTVLIVVVLVLATPARPAHAQAPGSAFGQQPQQLHQQLERPPARPSPAAPFAKPAAKTPNWNAAGSNTAPSSLSPPSAPNSAPRTAQPLKTGVPAKNARVLELSKEKLAKAAPNRTALLQTQLKIRDEQNRIALSLKGQGERHAMLATQATPSSSAFAGAPGRTSSLAAAAEARSPLAARNAKTQDALANQPDGIWSVNNMARDFVITPGGNVVIFGKGFGERPGQVLAKGLTGFPGGAAALQVTAWGNFEIDAVLPPGIRGVADLNGISLQALASSGKSFTIGNGRFYAERAEIVLPRTIDMHAVFDVRLSPNWTINFNPAEGSATDVEMARNGFVERFDDSSALTCKQPGADMLFSKDLPLGFQVSGIAMVYGRTDSGDGNGMPNGDSGSHTFTPGYSITWGQTTVAVGANRDKVVDTISIGWGVWRSHTSPGITQDKEDVCASSYAITEVDVLGPAGLSPF